jgi:anaerobic selenocysteine-containing dehydrogenase
MTTGTKIVLGTCHHDCPDSCGWVVTVEDGVATKLRGNPDHPFSRGELCPKVNRLLDRVYSPDRILHPLRRVGPKGSGQFEPVSWDTALDEIAQRVKSAIGAYGPHTVVPMSSAGNQGSLSVASIAERFFERLGATRLTGSVCGPVVAAGFAATNGKPHTIDPLDIRFSRLILLWGTNPKLTNRHLIPFIDEARAAGARVVVIDPVRTATADDADWFLQPLPGTDAALALAMMHVLIRDNLLDHDYIARYTLGFDDLKGRAAEWPPSRAAEVTGLGVDDIEQLAREYGMAEPSLIRTLVGAEHHEHGAMLARTLACLPLLTGAWRHRGGGLSRSVSIWQTGQIDKQRLVALPGHTPTPRRTINVNHMARALNDPALSPPITALFLWNGNQLNTQPNSELFRRGLLRDDLFTVVHEQFLTDTARYADIVLPATTQIEQDDVVGAWGHLYIGANNAAIAPVGESVSNTELFRRLSRAMGYTEPGLFATDAELIDEALHALTPTQRAEMRDAGFTRLALPDDLRPFVAGGFGTASGRAEFRSESLAALGHDPLPTYVPAREGPQGDPMLRDRFPLVLITTKSHTRFLNSSYSHLPKHGPAEGGPFVEVHAVDAARRGLVEGQTVRMWNDRGAVTVPVRISDRVRPGVVSAPFGWWGQHDPDGGLVNSLTNDELSDWGGGVAFHDTLVEVSGA